MKYDVNARRCFRAKMFSTKFTMQNFIPPEMFDAFAWRAEGDGGWKNYYYHHNHQQQPLDSIGLNRAHFKNVRTHFNEIHTHIFARSRYVWVRCVYISERYDSKVIISRLLNKLKMKRIWLYRNRRRAIMCCVYVQARDYHFSLFVCSTDSGNYLSLSSLFSLPAFPSSNVREWLWFANACF